MDVIPVTIGDHHFEARFRDDLAPRTCERFRALLPFRNRLIHVRWSGEALWVPLGDMVFDVPPESATSHPAPGDIIIYPGGLSETEILLAYGGVSFASKAGPLAGNPLLTLMGDLDLLAKLGREILWEGAREIVFGR